MIVAFSFKVAEKLKGSCHYSLVDAALKPYRYACHFADIVPTQLPPHAKVDEFRNDDDPGALLIQAENLPALRSGELKAMHVPVKSFPDSCKGDKGNSGEIVTQWQKGAIGECGICAGRGDELADLAAN